MNQDDSTVGKLEDIASEYANNTFMEPSVWDLKIFFGQWYQTTSQSNAAGVDWQSAVTLPWMQVKLLAHYLKVNVALYESLHGKIHIPPDLRPKFPATQSAGSDSNPHG